MELLPQRQDAGDGVHGLFRYPVLPGPLVVAGRSAAPLAAEPAMVVADNGHGGHVGGRHFAIPPAMATDGRRGDLHRRPIGKPLGTAMKDE